MADIPVNISEALTVVDVSFDGQSTFDFDFRADRVEDMKALYQPAGGGVAVTLVGGIDFTATGLQTEGGGTIALVSLFAVAGSRIGIYRDISIERQTDYSRDLFADDLNREQDKIFMILQELARDTGRAVKLSLIGDDAEAGRVMVSDGAGGLVLGPDAGQISAASANAASASASAAAAQNFRDQTQALVNQVPALISDLPPLVIVAIGDENMMAEAGAANGPRFDMSMVRIWDRGVGQLRGGVVDPVNVQSKSYAVHNGVVGGGKNNLALAFAYRLYKKTGRDSIIIYNSVAGRNISALIGSGRNSADWVILNADIAAAMAAAGAVKADYVLFQSGGWDALSGIPVGSYAASLSTLRAQAMAETWWSSETVILVGRPCVRWSNAVALNYLLNEIATFGNNRYGNSGLAENRSIFFPGGIFEGTEYAYDGRALYSLGFYNYFDAIPSWKMPVKETLKELFKKSNLPYPAAAYATPDSDVAYSDATLVTPKSKYNLEPSITRVGPTRFFVGYTANKTNASEGDGTFVRLTYTDDQWTTVVGVDTPFAGFVGNNAAAPKLWACPDGSLWCFFHESNQASQVFDGIAGVWLSVCRNPLGTSPRWSKPKKVVEFGWAQDPLFVDGQWCLPVSYWRLPNGGGFRSFVPALAGRYLFKIDYSKVELEHFMTVASETPNSLYDEHWVYSLLSGRLRAIWRTSDGPYFADATDFHGEVWGAPAPFTQVGTPRPSAKTTGCMSPTGRFLIAYNNAPDRTKMTLSMSDFNSSTSLVAYTRELEAGSSAYPSIFADGTFIWIAMDQGNRRTVTGGGTGGKILVKRVTEQNFADGVGGVGNFVVDAGT